MCGNIPSKCSSDIHKTWFIRCRENTAVYSCETGVLEEAVGTAITMLEFDQYTSHVDIYEESEFLYGRFGEDPLPFFTVRYSREEDIVGTIRPLCVDSAGWLIVD